MEGEYNRRIKERLRHQRLKQNIIKDRIDVEEALRKATLKDEEDEKNGVTRKYSKKLDWDYVKAE